ncbi:Aspartate/glutamate/uridylate kinase [Lentinula aciculospora]|uniref:Aspartokinase n=1 Tax=Lentinula aciculospora TaxID=153920 RepID=A0A9W8ZU26_9AGAR|nr:Aspartate/glutamate/uridylate kinase [Lentinula aciculospora]
MPTSPSLSSSSSSSGRSPSPPKTPPNLHQNSIDPDSKWLVQKFGGTSVGKFPVQIATEVVAKYIDSNKVAVVCSARSGTSKALGTTNLLLRAASEALVRRPKPLISALNSPNGAMSPYSGLFGQSKDMPHSPPETPRRSRSASAEDAAAAAASLTPLTVPQRGQTIPAFNTTVDLIRQEHFKAAADFISDPDIRQEFEEEVDKDCDWLRSFLFASQVINEVSPRSKDSIIGLGERLACKFMTAVLQDQGIDAEYVSLEDVVPEVEEEFLGNDTLDQNFYDNVAQAVGERVNRCGRRVPVVTGFFGPIPGSLLTQVGRGYTDLLSALLSVGLEASELQIWKEVDGIFTADPRKVSTARLLPIISPDEAAELTYYGSEVVHPFTMEQAIRCKIPIRIKNVSQELDANNSGIPEPISQSQLHEMAQQAVYQHIHNPHKKFPTAVTIKERIIVINVNSNRKSVSHGFFAVHVSMAIEDALTQKLFDRLLMELVKSGSVSVHRNMAILSLVGRNMRHLVGIAGRMFTTLGNGNVNIEMISQGASEINISCLQLPTPGKMGPWLF